MKKSGESEVSSDSETSLNDAAEIPEAKMIK